MNEKILVDRYEIVDQRQDGFVVRTVVKDLKAYGKLRTLLSLDENSLSNPNIVAWFDTQSELFTTISSDHVVDFIDRHGAGEIMTSPTVVIEEPGRTLADLMANGPIQPAAAQNIIIKVLLGISELHEHGYLHLDIRPETIGVNDSATEVKLLSLGNCHKLDSEAISLCPNTRYGAAECYNSNVALERDTDIYSVGFMLYEMLCGEEIYGVQFGSIVNTQSDLEQATNWTNWHVSDKEIYPITKYMESIDPDFATCIHKMLDKDKDKRYKNASNVIHDMDNVQINNTGLNLTGDFNKDKSPVKGKNRLWKILGLALGVLLSVGAASAWYFMKVTAANKTDYTQLNALVSDTDLQRKVMSAYAWEEDAEIQAANESYQLITAAFEVEDYESMFTHAQQSNTMYASIIQRKAPATLDSLESDLQQQYAQAQTLGVVDQPEAELVNINLDDMGSLIEAHAAYTEQIANVKTSIVKNNRMVDVGSTPEQIDAAFVQCQEYSTKCERNWYESEALRAISLKPYVLDKLEVSVQQFQSYVDESGFVTEAETRKYSNVVDNPAEDYAVMVTPDTNWTNNYAADSSDLPVVHVTKRDAESYCAAQNKRLPTEAEWEYAAAGPERTIYPWGDEWDASLLYWLETAALESVRSVGSFPASNTGIFDLAGSVSEWTATTDESGASAYIKGASRFDNNVANMRIALRRLESVDYSGEDVGFRCAEDSEEWPQKGDLIEVK